MFEKLEQIITIKVRYTADGNVSINTGRGDGIRDNLVIREGDEGSNPVISGSSVKGVVRSTIEALLAQAGQRVCIPDTCVPGRSEPEKEQYLREHSNLGRKGLSSRCEPPCLVCQMFGRASTRSSQAGRVLFGDARYREDEPLLTISRSHVAIARDTRSQATGALMTVETVPADAVFEGEIVLHNPEPWMVGGVLAALDLLDKTGIGAKKTAGYGKMRVEVQGISVQTFGPAKPPQPATVEVYEEAWKKLVPSQVTEIQLTKAEQEA